MSQKVSVIYRMEELKLTELEKAFFEKEEVVYDLLKEKKSNKQKR